MLQSFHYTVKDLNQSRPAQPCMVVRSVIIWKTPTSLLHFSFAFIRHIKQYCTYKEPRRRRHYTDWATNWTFQASDPGVPRNIRSPKCPHRLWGPPSLLPNGQRSGVKLTTHLHVAARLRISSTIPFTPLICFQDLFSDNLPVCFTYQTHCSRVDYTTHELTFL